MKKIFFFATFTLLVSGFLLASAHNSHAMMGGTVYDFTNAEIMLETTAPMSKTIQKISVGEGGKYVKEETTTEIDAFGMKRKETQITYTDRTKNMVYAYNLDTNEASATDISEMIDGAKKQNMYAFNKESLEKWGGKILRKEKYQGLDCTVVEFTNFMSTVWFYKKYPVKMISNAGGMEIKTELVSFKEGAAKDYKLPSNAKIGETQSISDIMSKMQAYKNDPEYQEEQSQLDNEYDSESMPDTQKSMDEAGSQFQDVMKAFSDMMGKSE